MRTDSAGSAKPARRGTGRLTMLPGKPSPTPQDSPRGRILRITDHSDGTSRVRLDNGPDNTITIVTHSELLPGLLGQDMKAIHAHLMTRTPGHFRKK